ncbi:MAG: hypothetical protein MSC45_08050 [Mobiluncus sp.]|nr:hypothetical protein [Mobiluncus sp.]
MKSGHESRVFINKSAFKHGINPEDILNCMEFPRDIHLDNPDPAKWLYLGFLISGIPLKS